MSQGTAHLGYLDSVRGLAALAVVGSHYVNGYDLPCLSDFCNRLLTYSPLHLFWDGAAAVNLFFVLSGLVLSLKHFRESATPDLSQFRLGQYCVSRLCRIWPPYLAVLAACAWLYPHYRATDLPATVPRQNDWLPSLWARPLDWGDFLHDSFLPGMSLDMAYLPQAWTLSLELGLSLLVPVGILLAARSSAWLVFFALFAIYPLGLAVSVFHFILGILLAKHHRQLSAGLLENPTIRRFALLLGFSLYVIGEPLGVFSDAIANAGLKRLLGDLLGCASGLGAALLILCGFASVRMRQILSCRPLRFVGKVSYSLYLVHLAVLINATPFLLAWLDIPSAWPVSAWWAGLLASLGLSIVIAMVSHRFIEVPSIALGKRLGMAFNI